jgi:polar amino acid transport system substrate-binding protein
MLKRILIAATLAMASPVAADVDKITVSSNSTPLDQAVLSAVASEAFARNGIDFELVNFPSERSLRMADAGEVDGEGVRIAGLSETFPNLVQAVEPIVGISFVAFAKDPEMAFEGWHSLKGKRLAFINGWKLFESQTADMPGVNKVDSPAQMFAMLNAGRVDLVLYTLADGRQYLQDTGMEGIHALTPHLRDLDLYLYLHNSHSELAEKVAETLRGMKDDGTYDEILAGILPE